MATTTFDLDVLLSDDRDTWDGCDGSWLSHLSLPSSGLHGLCGFCPHESAGFPLYPQGLNRLTGFDAPYNSLPDPPSAPMTVIDDFLPFLDPLESSLGEPCSMSLWDPWVYQTLDDFVSPQNHIDTATTFPPIHDTELEGLELTSGAPITGSCAGTLLQCVNDSDIQAPSSASSDAACADSTDAIVLTGEGSVPNKSFRPSRPVSASQTDISGAQIKSTGALYGQDECQVLILIPPSPAADLPAEDISAEDPPAKRRKGSSPPLPGKRRKLTSPAAKQRKPSPCGHNLRIAKITCDNRTYDWDRRGGSVWKSDDDSLRRSDVPFDRVTEVEVFPDGLGSLPVILLRNDTGLFCGKDGIGESGFSMPGDVIHRLVRNPEETQRVIA